MINSIRGNIVYNFDYNFQQDNLKFEFNEFEENVTFPCFPSTFCLIKGHEDDEENGVYFERIDNIIYLRKFDISKEYFNSYLEENNYDESDLHIFYTWKDLWEEWQNYNCKSEEDEDDDMYYMLKDLEEDIISVAKLSNFEYKRFITLSKKYPKASTDIELEQDGITVHIKNLIINHITKSQWDILDNTEGIELYIQFMNEFERLEKKNILNNNIKY